jgi:hypothetical protein
MRTEENNTRREDGTIRPAAMTLSQALLFIIYFAIFSAILVAIIGPLIAHGYGLSVNWKNLLLAMGFFAGCGPIFIVLIYWLRLSRKRPLAFAIRGGLTMSAIMMLYASAAALSLRTLGLSFFPLTALPGYLVEVLLLIAPSSALVSYFVWRWKIGSSLHQSS